MVVKLLNGSSGAFADRSGSTRGSSVVGVSCEVSKESLMYEEGLEIAEVTSHDFRLAYGKKHKLRSVGQSEDGAGPNTVRRRIGWSEHKR